LLKGGFIEFCYQFRDINYQAVLFYFLLVFVGPLFFRPLFSPAVVVVLAAIPKEGKVGERE